MADVNRERLEYLTQETDFFDLIQDETVREQLAVSAGAGVFYSGLDLGDGMDVSLRRALHLVGAYKEFFDNAAEQRKFPEEGSLEFWQSVLDEVNEGKKSEREPGRARKAVASFALRQEIRTSRGIYPTSFARAKEFKAEAERDTENQ